MQPRTIFTIVFALVLAERLFEMALSARHVRLALARGGRLAPMDPYARMVLLHSCFMLAAPLEVWLVAGAWPRAVAWTMTGAVAAAMALRYWAVATLGERWSARVVSIPGLPAVTGGPYRWIRHPNYVAVAIEILALPLVAGAWRTALVFSLANGLLLRARIRVEEGALEESSDYRRLLGPRPRFLPGAGSRPQP